MYTSCNDTIHVRVQDTVPGSCSKKERIYYPKLSWKVYEDTFKYIREHPGQLSKEWPYYPFWKEWILMRFGGKTPTYRHAPNQGYGWSWPCQEAAFRRILMSYDHYGYKPEWGGGGEAFSGVVEDDGGIAVFQGNKRTALLRIDDYEKPIPFIVRWRSDLWEATRRDISSVSGGKKNLYMPLPFPDFEGWTVSQPCTERLAFMEEELGDGRTRDPGSVLDLGCHTGWFCRAFADKGWSAVGVEEEQPLVKVAHKANLWLNRMDRAPEESPEYFSCTVEDYFKHTPETYDVILCLSLIMHLFRQKGEEAWGLLNEASKRCKLMFLDIVYGAYSKHFPFTPETFGEQMLEHTEFTSYQELGRTKHENRPFYVFRR